MIDLTTWTADFLAALENTFGNRICFVGLQGSHARGEANETSDIDMVVILDALSPVDLQTYQAMLNTLPHRELVCGFLSGKEELLRWDPADLFSFCNDTISLKGNLMELCPKITLADVARAIKTGLCNIYHGCVHNMVHDHSDDILRELYKSASFLVQLICFQETGHYIRRKSELRGWIAWEEQQIINTFFHLKNGGDVDFQAMSDALFLWTQKWIQKIP